MSCAVESPSLVQFDDADPADVVSRQMCLDYLADCGHVVSVEPYEVQGPDGEPCVSWGDLSDLWETADS